MPSSSDKTCTLFASLVLQIYEKGFIRKSIRPKKDETFSERRRAFVPVLCCEWREAMKRRGSSSGESGKRSRGSAVWQNYSWHFSCEQGGARRKPGRRAEKVGSYSPKTGSKLRNAPRFYIVVLVASEARRVLAAKGCMQRRRLPNALRSTLAASARCVTSRRRSAPLVTKKRRRSARSVRFFTPKMDFE